MGWHPFAPNYRNLRSHSVTRNPDFENGMGGGVATAFSLSALNELLLFF